MTTKKKPDERNGFGEENDSMFSLLINMNGYGAWTGWNDFCKMENPMPMPIIEKNSRNFRKYTGTVAKQRASEYYLLCKVSAVRSRNTHAQRKMKISHIHREISDRIIHFSLRMYTKIGAEKEREKEKRKCLIGFIDCIEMKTTIFKRECHGDFFFARWFHFRIRLKHAVCLNINVAMKSSDSINFTWKFYSIWRLR